MSESSCRRYRGEESVRVRRMVRFPSPVVNRSLLSWAGSGDPVNGRVRCQKPTTTMTPAHPRPACWRATPTVRHPVLQPGHAARLPRLPARPAAATRPQQDADRVGRCRADQRCPAPRGPAARARPCCRASPTGQGGLAQRPARRRPPPPRRYPARPARRHAAAPQPRVRARSAEPPHHHCSAPPAGDHDPASAADPGVGDTPTATKRLHPIGAGRVSQEPKPLSTKYSARRSTRFQRRPVDRYKPLTRAFVE